MRAGGAPARKVDREHYAGLLRLTYLLLTRPWSGGPPGGGRAVAGPGPPDSSASATRNATSGSATRR